MKRIPLALLAIALLIFSCDKKGGGSGNGSVVHVSESKPEDFTLDFQKPEIFTFEINEEGEYNFGLEFTYFSEQLQGWDKLPVYYIHIQPDKSESDKKVDIPLKENGEWKGKLLDNGQDRVLEGELAQGVRLQAGEHELRLYGNTSSEKPILGIVSLAFKVYE